MLKICKVLLCTAVFATTTSSFATAKMTKDDYDADYYSEEGRVTFKIRVSGMITNDKQTGLPAASSVRGLAGARASKHLISNGFGIEGVTNIFFSDYIGAEMGVGWSMYKMSKSAIENVAYNYSNTYNVSKRKNLYAIPLTFTMQYHVAPFGAIRPYVGAGYGGTYFLSKTREVKLKSAHGPVGQIGCDVVMTDDTTFNVDIRKYSLSPKATYSNAFVGPNGQAITSKVKLNPLVISAGVGIKF